MKSETFAGQSERDAKNRCNRYMGSVNSEAHVFSCIAEDPQHEQGMAGVPSKKRGLRSSQKTRVLKAFSLALFGFTVFVFASHLTSTPSNASGFSLFTSGASELGMCDSVIAHTEGPASNFWNPALLPNLKGTQIEIGTMILKPEVDFKSDSTGINDSMKKNTYFPSTLFITHQINEKFSAGFGINNTFGLGTEWPDDWEGRYLATLSELETYNLNPNLAWKLSDKVILACGFDILLGDATLEQKIDLSGLGLPDGNQKIEGDGEGYGYNLGILWNITHDLAFGMSYRSKIKLEIEGDYSLTQVGLKADVKTDLELPAHLFTGIAYRPSKNLLLEIGGKWEEWSTYKHLKLKADQPIFSGSDVYLMPRDWKDVYGFNLGAKYNIDPTLAVSVGYLHEGNPVPSHTFDPSIPASNRNDLSFGIQKVFREFRIALSYLYESYDDRHKRNNVGMGLANGKYEQHIHIFALSLSYML